MRSLNYELRVIIIITIITYYIRYTIRNYEYIIIVRTNRHYYYNLTYFIKYDLTRLQIYFHRQYYF